MDAQAPNRESDTTVYTVFGIRAVARAKRRPWVILLLVVGAICADPPRPVVHESTSAGSDSPSRVMDKAEPCWSSFFDDD